ncbi:MAG: hypothetical protein QM779_14720 [Propionicimonas sp.]|uniref:hypothetical protein n=1 Tax=Propionicimonas sp. TaxID=1955623 RepID=UPI003D0AA298
MTEEQPESDEGRSPLSPWDMLGLPGQVQCASFIGREVRNTDAERLGAVRVKNVALLALVP